MLTKNLKKILIIKHGSLGDIAFALQAMYSIKSHFKDAEIYILTEKSFENFFIKSKYFDKIIIDNRRGLINSFRLIKNLLRENFDLVIDLQNSKRSNLYNFFLRYFGRTIINGNRFNSNYRYFIKPKGDESPKAGLINQIKLLGIKISEDNYEWLNTDIKLKLNEDIILVIPSTSKSGIHKRWPVKKYADLCKKLEDYGKFICLIGTENDRKVNSIIINKCKNIIDLTGKSPPEVIFSVASQCKLIISNDTGPGHIAALSKNRVIWIAQNNATTEINIENNKLNELILSNKIEEITVDNVLSKIKYT